jgi:hypothetical protein
MERGVWLDPSLGRTTFAEWAREWMIANPAKRATTAARDKVFSRPISSRRWEIDP